MTKQILTRKASDNEYLHKDFHGALSVGVEYLRRRYGDDAVREYLRQFASSFYAPLKTALKERGLIAVKKHYENVYKIEGGKVEFSLSDDELILNVEACPAVTHMREKGYPVSELFHETSKSVNEAICEDSPFAFELVQYNPETGKSVQRFYRKAK
ncbi:MAG: hypothetical protein JXA11_04030 [Phycisphaerae bacterium]|nr:hypothetical protein [Phycisphaerae bacterium]